MAKYKVSGATVRWIVRWWILLFTVEMLIMQIPQIFLTIKSVFGQYHPKCCVVLKVPRILNLLETCFVITKRANGAKSE